MITTTTVMIYRHLFVSQLMHVGTLTCLFLFNFWRVVHSVLLTSMLFNIHHQLRLSLFSIQYSIHPVTTSPFITSSSQYYSPLSQLSSPPHHNITHHSHNSHHPLITTLLTTLTTLITTSSPPHHRRHSKSFTLRAPSFPGTLIH